MFRNPDLARLIQQDLLADAARARFQRAAACARACCSAPANTLDRLIRIVRPAPTTCEL